MSEPYEDALNDLFDFPAPEGLEEFGLAPPRAGGAASLAKEDAATPRGAAGEPAPEATRAEGESATTETAQQVAAKGPAVDVSAARPNPAQPEGISDLDEDLFQFDEIFTLEGDPYQNGTLQEDGQPSEALSAELAAADVASALPASTPEVPPAAPQPASQPAGQPVAAEPAAAPPAQSQAQAQVQSQPQPSGPAAAPLDAAAPAAPSGQAAQPLPTHQSHAPRMLPPMEPPITVPPEHKRTFAILVACFLAVNTGIFFLAQQASSNFQATLKQTTGMLADAIVQGKESAPTSASVPVQPEVVYVTQEAVEPSLPEAARAPYVDPRDYANTHEIAVGSAKSMLADGKFEDARRLLNHVLANQARIPLSPSLREEIDYLIPLTYFEQGNATAGAERSSEVQK